MFMTPYGTVMLNVNVYIGDCKLLKTVKGFWMGKEEKLIESQNVKCGQVFLEASHSFIAASKYIIYTLLCSSCPVYTTSRFAWNISFQIWEYFLLSVAAFTVHTKCYTLKEHTGLITQNKDLTFCPVIY